MRTLAALSDRLTYVGPVALTDFSPYAPWVARAAMDGVPDHRKVGLARFMGKLTA